MRKTRNSRTTIALSLVCGTLCALCVFAYTSAVRAQAEEARSEALARYGGEQVEVCVAARDIAPGEAVDIGAVQTRLWVADLLPDDAVKSPSEIVGKRATSSILKGEVVSLKRFSESSYVLEVPPGYTAISVPAKDVQAVGGALCAGMYVDIYATGDTSTSLLGRKVLVLATSATRSEDTSTASVTWVTIAVVPECVEELVSAAQKTQLYFVLPGQEIDDANPQGTKAEDRNGEGHE